MGKFLANVQNVQGVQNQQNQNLNFDDVENWEIFQVLEAWNNPIIELLNFNDVLKSYDCFNCVEGCLSLCEGVKKFNLIVKSVAKIHKIPIEQLDFLGCCNFIHFDLFGYNSFNEMYGFIKLLNYNETNELIKFIEYINFNFVNVQYYNFKEFSKALKSVNSVGVASVDCVNSSSYSRRFIKIILIKSLICWVENHKNPTFEDFKTWTKYKTTELKQNYQKIFNGASVRAWNKEIKKFNDIFKMFENNEFNYFNLIVYKHYYNEIFKNVMIIRAHNKGTTIKGIKTFLSIGQKMKFLNSSNVASACEFLDLMDRFKDIKNNRKRFERFALCLGCLYSVENLDYLNLYEIKQFNR